MADPRQVEDAVQENMTPYNPTDAAVMKQEGMDLARMSVEEFLTKLGVDPKGPATQLSQIPQMARKQGSTVNKMRSIAGQPGGGPPRERPSMDGLLGG
jgi:hypothetical protein